MNAIKLWAVMFVIMLPGCMEIEVDTSEIDKYIQCTDDGFKFNTLTSEFLMDDQGRAVPCERGYR